MNWLTRFLPSLIPGLTSFANPWVLGIVAAVAIGSFTMGWKVESWRWDASLRDIAEANTQYLQAFAAHQRQNELQTEKQLLSEKTARERDRENFEEQLRHVPKERLVEVRVPAPVPGAERSAAVVVAPTARLTNDFRGLWNDGLLQGLAETERADWIAGANSAAGPVEADDVLRNLRANATLLGECRAREQGWIDWAKREGMTE